MAKQIARVESAMKRYHIYEAKRMLIIDQSGFSFQKVVRPHPPKSDWYESKFQFGRTENSIKYAVNMNERITSYGNVYADFFRRRSAF